MILPSSTQGEAKLSFTKALFHTIFFDYFFYSHLLRYNNFFFGQGGDKLCCQNEWGPWPDKPLWIHHCLTTNYKLICCILATMILPINKKNNTIYRISCSITCKDLSLVVSVHHTSLDDFIGLHVK